MRAFASVTVLALASSATAARFNINPLGFGITTTVAAPPSAPTSAVPVPNCSSGDSRSGTLISSAPSTDLEGGVVCTYANTRGCDYFSNGNFSGGSSLCPASADPATPPSSTPDSTTPSAPSSTSTPAAVACPSGDSKSGALVSTDSSVDIEGGVVCDYDNALGCEYFPNGNFASGSSSCPSSAGPAEPATPPVGTSPSTGGGDLTAVVINGLSCPGTDDNGSALVSVEGTTSSDNPNGISCAYEQARSCEYFSNATFSSGSSVCPGAADPAAPTSAPVGARQVARVFRA